MQTPEEALKKHLRPLYISLKANGRPIEKVLVDNGAVVNILPSKMMKLLNKTDEVLIPTEVIVSNFAGGTATVKGVLALQLTIGSRKMNATFFVVDSSTNYNMLLGRDCIHANGCVPSSLHQALIFLSQHDEDGVKEMEIFWADTIPFHADTNNVESILYKKMEEDLQEIGEEVLQIFHERFQQLDKDLPRPNILKRLNNISLQ
ncbi:hypothetical protein U1Q18_052683 [Sarracenia purpurea var. burkii]